MNNRLRDPTQQFMNHHCFVLFGNTVKGFLNHMAAEWIHAETQCVPSDSISNSNNLLGSSVFEATLDQKVPKPIDHKGIGLVHYGFDNLVLLFSGAHFEFLLEENGGLLVITAYDLVHNVFPVAGDIFVEESAIVKRLER